MKLVLRKIGIGKPIVCLSGFGFSADIFLPLIKHLSQQYQFYLIDLPGFGQTPYVPYTIETLLLQLQKIVPNKAIWMGWSLGGTIALSYALQYPEAVQKLILLSTTPKFVAESDWPGMPEAVFSDFLARGLYDWQKLFRQFVLLQFAPGMVNKKIYKELSQSHHHPNLTTGAIEQALSILHNSDLRRQLSHIGCPNLWLTGDKDQLVSIQTFSSDYFEEKASLRQTKVIEGAGHILFLSHCDLIQKYIENFLRG